MTRYVITGASGLLGRELVRTLDAGGPLASAGAPDEVCLLTRKVGASADPRSVATDYSAADLARLVEGADVVVHLAASRSADRDAAAHAPGLLLADRVFDAAAGRVGQIVFASSISVYGKPGPQPWRETDLPRAAHPYGVFKHAAERLGVGRTAGTDTVFTSLRFGHLYGADEHNGYLVNVLIDQAARGEDLRLRAPARAARDFLWAGEAARAVVAAARRRAPGVFNIGSGEPVTNEQLARAVLLGFARARREAGLHRGLHDEVGAVLVDDPDADEGISPTHMDVRQARDVLGFARELTHVEAFGRIAAHRLSTSPAHGDAPPPETEERP